MSRHVLATPWNWQLNGHSASCPRRKLYRDVASAGNVKIALVPRNAEERRTKRATEAR